MTNALSTLETALRSRRAPYEKNKDGTLEIQAESRLAVYPILFSEEQHGWVQALVWFPPVDQLVLDVKELCAEIMRWMSGVQVHFHSKTQRFYVGAFIRPDALWLEIQPFLTACDIVFPLLQHVGETGKWNMDLVDLAFTPVEDLRPN